MPLFLCIRCARVLSGIYVLLLIACNGQRAGHASNSAELNRGETSSQTNTPSPTPARSASPSPDPHAMEPGNGAHVREKSWDRPRIDFSSVEAAMAVLAYAMQTKDTSLLLECFSRGTSWQSTNTVEKPWQRTKFKYERLATGLQLGGDFRNFFFGDDGDDCLRNYFVGQNLGAWRAIGKLRFAPPGSSAEPSTFVQWRKQGERHVVSEIAFPAD
jgi:hypothetical protein